MAGFAPHRVGHWTHTVAVRIELTVHHAGDECDVAVASPGPVPLSALAAELARVGGVPEAGPVWSGEVPLAGTAVLGGPGLRTGAVLNYGGPHRAYAEAGVLALHQVGGPGAGRVVPIGRGDLVIGRGCDCDVVLADPDVSRRHADISVSATTIVVRDAGSTNGTYVEGRPVGAAGQVLRPGDVVRVGACSLSIAGPTQTPATVISTTDGAVRILRPPRHTPPPPAAEIDVPARASAARPRGVQWITALLPAIVGGAIAWTTHSPQFLLFALLSPVMMLSSSLGDRLHWRRSRRRDAASYGRRRAAADREITDALRTETAARRQQSPDAAALARLVALPGSRVWERRRTDADLLQVRIGTADLPSSVRAREAVVTAPAGVVRDVPFPVNLRDGPLGLVGPREVVAGAARWIIGQLAVLHSPVDVGICVVVSPDVAADWAWARWLPQLRGRSATDEDEWAALVVDLAAEVEQRLAARRMDRDGWSGPWQVIVLDRASRLAGVPGLGRILERGPAVGVTAVCLDDDVTRLPSACRTVVQVNGDTGTRARVRDDAGTDHPGVLIDAVSPEWADAVARRIAPLVDGGDDPTGGVPDSCGLLDTLGRDPRSDARPVPHPSLDGPALRARWAAADGGAAAPIGLSSDGPLIVDLVADGPHALVAGTTGAGKSELLQSLVAGLAANHSPDDVNFLLIDYKGGAAFADCALLPHTAGLVTDLDRYLTERALRSLRSELHRRERLFADAGATDLATYRRAGAAAPIARLIIVVDEFAALADELPDFVRGLVGVAQRGRSLGVHLVLATQRPGSAVSPEIRANTSLRIALRMTDVSESSDVIDAPDAASIERSLPGRAYLRAGPTLTCFQTAYAGRSTPEHTGVLVERLDAWRRPLATRAPVAETSELTRLVAALRAAARTDGRSPARRPWLAPLPDRLPRQALASDNAATIAIGLVDLPDEQRQPNLTLDLAAGGSVLCAGAPRSGRTGVLASLLAGALARFGPDRLSVYLIDAAGALATIVRGLPHCATTLGPDEIASAAILLRRLETACSQSADRALATASPAPLNLLLVDGWDALVAGLPDAEALDCADSLANLLRAGPAAALTTVVTGDRSVLAPRLAAGFGQKLLLGLSDPHDYGLAGISPRAVPAAMPPGRALRGSDGALVQVAHAGDEPGLAGAARALHTAAAAVGGSGRPDAIRLRPLPRSVTLSTLSPHRVRDRGRMVLGLAGDRAEPVHIDLFAGAGRVLVAGPPRSGRSTVLRSLLTQAVEAGLDTVVAAAQRSPLRSLAAELAVRVFEPHTGGASLGAVPRARTLLLVDDCEGLVDTPSGDALTEWVRAADAPLAAVVAGRADDLATSYRGLGALVRRANCGLLLRPGPVDGEILGVRLPRRAVCGPPGRGVLVGDPSWGAAFEDGDPVPIQVAQP